MQAYVTAPSDFFERVKFSLTYTEIPGLFTLSLKGKRVNFPSIATMLHTDIVRRSENLYRCTFQILNRIKIGGQQ